MIDLKEFKLEDLKKFSLNELDDLATTLRKEIIDKVSINGGHLASNLGVVELTIALHYVFNSPHDKLIYDVSHQTYTHKLLTGRSLDNLRKFNGVSGFSKTSESVHDVFEAGHSSTSIGAGLGFLYAKEQGADIGEVISIIGDASVTNGLAFEALNILGQDKNKKMIIIINDNDMSISKNVGSLAKTLNKVRIGKGYRAFKTKVPKFIYKLGKKVSSSLKAYAYNNKFFSSLGYSYIEGIDGHNFKELFKYLTYAKESKNSVVLHVKTIKGKGYKFAEEDKIGLWHHVPPFNLENGEFYTKKEKTTGEYISDYLISKKDKWNKMHIITPAMSLGSGILRLQNELGNRFIDCGIAEELAILIGSSLSINNRIPFIFIYSSFLQRAYDQILHDAARTNQHMIICVDRAGIVSSDGDTHQGIYDLAFLSTIPNVKIYEPKSIEDLFKTLDYAYNNHGLYVIRYHKILQQSNLIIKSINNYDLLLDLKNKNVITYGKNSLNFYQYIIENNLNYGLISVNNLLEIDKTLLTQLDDNSTLIVFDEVIETNSLGYNLLNNKILMQKNIEIKHYSLPNTYLVNGTEEEILKFYKLTLEDIFKEEE